MTEPFDLSLRQLLGAWERICAPGPRPARDAHAGLEFVFSGLPIPFLNFTVVTDRGLSAAGLGERGREACGWARGREVPWFFVLTHEGLAPGVDAAGALAPTGLVPGLPMTGMLAQRVAPLAEPPRGLELLRPADDAGCAALLDVNSAAYEIDMEPAKPAIGTGAFWREHVPVLGRADGAPACSAAVMMVDGYRYVALVATAPSMQRRGYADAAMRRALDLAAREHGELPTFLHATDAGRPVYERMGYAALTTHTLFLEQRFVPG